ncbi:hypothetical protein HMPREF9015_01986 [Leptotrichia wadei F0279]|uniref:Uncharacterized protein n=1 Tax=Leptotrichia wadei (strain F0279) TaxID=888055 RepID=U2R3G9_LEPWF|nr:hypothetical protein HMPREF9015_01986 [Leptotrichia wadei F0279]
MNTVKNSQKDRKKYNKRYFIFPWKHWFSGVFILQNFVKAIEYFFKLRYTIIK